MRKLLQNPLLFGLPLLLVMFCIGVTVWLWPTYRQHLAIQQMQQLSPGYSIQPVGVSMFSPWVQQNTHKFLPLQKFQHVIELHIYAAGTPPGVTSANLHLKNEFPFLQSIRIYSGGIHADAFKVFSNHEKLSQIEIQNSVFRDDQTLYLENLPNLQRVYLNFVNIRHIGLKNLPALSYLDLKNTHLYDDTLDDLEHLPNLKYLGVAHSNITDKGLAKIARIPNLQRLDLRIPYLFSKNKVSREALLSLYQHPSLKRIYLYSHEAEIVKLNKQQNGQPKDGGASP